jgi:hypothetical protein
MIRMSILLGLLFVLAGSGCSPSAPAVAKAYPVKGKVVLASGTPISAGRVHLHPRDNAMGVEAFGEIEKDGTFTLTTYAVRDGAVPGHYAVTVEPYSYKTGNLKLDKATRIPKRYWEPGTSDLTVEVTSQDNLLPPISLR